MTIGLIVMIWKPYESTWTLDIHWLKYFPLRHYSDLIMSTMASQITSLMIIYSTVNSGTDQRKHLSSKSLAFVRGIHQWPDTITTTCYHRVPSWFTKGHPHMQPVKKSCWLRKLSLIGDNMGHVNLVAITLGYYQGITIHIKIVKLGKYWRWLNMRYDGIIVEFVLKRY